jgi:hypothetical protein
MIWRAVMAGALLIAPAAARAQSGLPTGSALPPSSVLATPTGRGSAARDSLNQIYESTTRPVPVTPSRPVQRPDVVWVPDRYAPIPGAPEGVLVPGHWERRLPGGDVYVPPIVIVHPDGRQEVFPAGVQPPVDHRNAP